MKRDPSQLDFFQVPVFEARSAVERIDLDRFRARLKRDMARAIRECPYDRPVIAARMAQYLGLASVSKGALDAYTAESKTGHDVSLVRFKAFVRATGAVWLWDSVVSEDGLTFCRATRLGLPRLPACNRSKKRSPTTSAC